MSRSGLSVVLVPVLAQHCPIEEGLVGHSIDYVQPILPP